jgi:hypothetical protein
MKRLALLLTLAALGGTALRAQDTHQGPVVYPATAPAGNAQDNSTSATTPSAPAAMAPDTNSALATPVPDANANNAVPPADAPAPAMNNMPAPAAPGSSGALNPFSASSSAPTANGKPDDIYDIRQPYFYLKSWTWLWVLLAALAVIAGAVALWMWLAPLRARRAQSAYELALEKLEKARGMINEQNPEPYAVFVSETIRTYLGQRFHTPSTRRTTEEFLRQMQGDAATPLAAHRDLLRGFLEACDLVKFAHYEPGLEELEQVQQRAVSFVTATRPMEGASA